MSLTTMDEKPALIIIDLQKGMSGFNMAHPFDEIVGRSRQLADAFRERGLPVVLVNVSGFPPGRTDTQKARRASGFTPSFPDDWTEIVDELDPQDSDLRVTKQASGAFSNTGLAETLSAHGVTQVVVTGVATSIGVESTARQAHDNGLNVVLVTDAMTDVNRIAHDGSITHVFPMLGESATTEDILMGLTDMDA